LLACFWGPCLGHAAEVGGVWLSEELQDQTMLHSHKMQKIRYQGLQEVMEFFREYCTIYVEVSLNIFS